MNKIKLSINCQINVVCRARRRHRSSRGFINVTSKRKIFATLTGPPEGGGVAWANMVGGSEFLWIFLATSFHSARDCVFYVGDGRLRTRYGILKQNRICTFG